MKANKASHVTELNVGHTVCGNAWFQSTIQSYCSCEGGDGISEGRAHARGANTPGAPHTNADVHHVLMIWPALENQQSEFGDGFGARFVGIQGLPEIISRFLAGPEDQQSEFGDGFGSRFVGLQGRPGLKTNKVSLMVRFSKQKPRQGASSTFGNPSIMR